MTTRAKNWILRLYLVSALWIEEESTILVTDTFCVLTSVILEQCSVQNMCIILCWQLLCNGFKHFGLSILYWKKFVGLFFIIEEGGCIFTPNIFIDFPWYLFHVILVSGDYHVTIGDVTKEVKPARNPQFVPCKYCKYPRANW